MALPSSGQITLNQVNVELGNSGTAQIGMNDSAVRSLFGVASGEIEMSDGYGASSEYVLSGDHSIITASTYISSGGTLRITGNIYSGGDTGTAGLTVDIACTIINDGTIQGRGGNGNQGNSEGYDYNSGNGFQPGGPGAAAINVTSSGVTIQNNSGKYIGGGGGGGGASYFGGNPPSGGGGGAGGGKGGRQSGSTPGVGTGGQGGNGGYYTPIGDGYGLPGTHGGRALGATNNNGTSSQYSIGGGGGKFGGAGLTGGSSGGGAAGPAITGTARTVVNNGTIYGAT